VLIHQTERIDNMSINLPSRILYVLDARALREVTPVGPAASSLGP
jgi:hypothetical protein